MEKRDSKRRIKRLEVTFSSNGNKNRGITSNVSEKGLFIRTKKGFAPGTALDIELHIPSGETLKLHGKVARLIKTQFNAVKNGMGIELLDLDLKYIQFIKSIE